MNKTNYHLTNNLKLNSARNIIVIVLLTLTIGGFLFSFENEYHQIIILLAVVFILCITNFLLLHYIFKHTVQIKDDYHQLTEFIQLKEKVGNEITLPSSRGYAASPDFLNEVLDTIKAIQPKKIVEASCGISTVSISEFLLKNGLTNVEHIALEHDEFYAKKCQSKVRNPNSKVILAPITEHNINGKKWKWYGIDQLQNMTDVDLLIVDGPPAYLQKNSRYPALPLLLKKLTNNCVVLMDDCYRPQEQNILALWKKEFQFDYEILFSEKGIGRSVRS